MAESNLKEMMIDDINEDVNEDNQISENKDRLKWYLIDTERTFCNVWNFWITLLIIYNMIVTPFVLVFPDVYYKAADDTKDVAEFKNEAMMNIEAAARKSSKVARKAALENWSALAVGTTAARSMAAQRRNGLK